jgi:glycosyltransferase involved in cell wall biosynthesis
VVAPADSVVAGELIPLTPSSGEIDAEVGARAHAGLRDMLGRMLRVGNVDLVHLHGCDFPNYLPSAGVPVLVTLHLPLAWYAPGALAPSRPQTWLQPVSTDQAARAPEGARLLPPIGNGVDLDAYAPGTTKGDYALILGRVAPEKGFDHAFEAARLAGAPLRAAGQVFPYAAHRRYFEEEVLPRCDGERQWIGPVAGAQKRRLLAEARCLLVPSTAPETSSLVAMEALASGTPVIAFRSGALPDIVEHGVTGFIVNDAAQMAAAIREADRIDGAACRRAACERFALPRMIGDYFELYERIAA